MYPHERSLVENMQGRPFTLLGVNNDDKLATVKNAIKENNLNWRSWYDGEGGPIVREFGITAFPTIFLVDHTGVIRYKNLRGPFLDKALEEMVTEAESEGMVGDAIVREPEFRTYKDKTGQYSIYAIFKSFADGKVTLEKKDGSDVTIELSQLSRRDQDFLTSNGHLQDTVAEKDSDESSVRLFTDSTGDFKVRATLVRVDGDSVILRREDTGKEITVPIDRFSDEDQRYIRDNADRDSG